MLVAFSSRSSTLPRFCQVRCASSSSSLSLEANLSSCKRRLLPVVGEVSSSSSSSASVVVPRRARCYASVTPGRVLNVHRAPQFRRNTRSLPRKFSSTMSSVGEPIDGKAAAAEVQDKLEIEVAQLKEKYNVTPKLAVVLVGGRPDSATYVRMKKQAAEKVGIGFELREVPADISQEGLLHIVKELNEDDEVHGLIVQLPLPAHIKETEILDAVSFEKDIDGFHPRNIGELTMRGREPQFAPCTPLACMHLLERSGTNLDGANVVVLGRSNIVGIPVAMLCMKKNATVTICHSRTKDLPGKVRQADVLIAAIGQPNFVKADWVKPGAVVIDVGINSIADSTRKSGSRLVGDVDYDQVKNVASKITPVPGGVGPMTVAMLLKNTVISARRILEQRD